MELITIVNGVNGVNRKSKLKDNKFTIYFIIYPKSMLEVI